MRNPTRTAATAAALMVGVALVSLMTSWRRPPRPRSTRSSTRRCGPTSSSAAEVSPAAPAASAPPSSSRWARSRRCSATAGIRSGVAKIYGTVTTVLATDPATVDAAVQHRRHPGRPGPMRPPGSRCRPRSRERAPAPRQPGRGHVPQRPAPRPSPSRPSTARGNWPATTCCHWRPPRRTSPVPRLPGLRQARPGVTASARPPRDRRVLAAYPNATLWTRPSTRPSSRSRSTSCSTWSTRCSRWRCSSR